MDGPLGMRWHMRHDGEIELCKINPYVTKEEEAKGRGGREEERGGEDAPVRGANQALALLCGVFEQRTHTKVSCEEKHNGRASAKQQIKNHQGGEARTELDHTTGSE